MSLNADHIEDKNGDFFLHIEGATPSICRIMEVLSEGSKAVGKGLGLTLSAAKEYGK